ncbi:MAG TPA: DinB family protein [Bryobacteraceae bacterium]|nr:DinB family protein [Bryobacteraceae bacterium]
MRPLQTESWLRGILPGTDPVTGHLVRAAEQITEEIEKALHALTREEVWATPHGMTSAGFHAKHLAGSTRRLCKYLQGRQLTPTEVSEIAEESKGQELPAELISGVEEAFRQYVSLIRTIRPEEFGSIREVGRQRLPVTAIGLAIHIAEHGARHLGQAITSAKLARAVADI